MPNSINSPPNDEQAPPLDSIIGAAIFDLSGLPREYFTTAENSDINWVQTIFQALGLQSLLSASLQLEGFSHATIHGKGYCAIVLKQKNSYTALLLNQTNIHQPTGATPIMTWLQTLEPSTLKANPRFNAA